MTQSKEATASTPVSIEDLDFVRDSDVPFQMRVLDPSGTPMDLWLLVLGSESEKVQKFTRRHVNQQRREHALKLKSGKVDEFDPIENDVQYMIDGATVRTVGWEGAKEPFSENLARLMFTRNPHIRAQVMEASKTRANFLRSKPTS